LTVLRAEETTQTLVLEYSARGIGHIRYLCGIARPDISLVLNVGAAHLGEFGSREAIATAKGELVEALSPDGVAVLNADDDLVRAMARRTGARVTTFGVGADADVRIESLRTDDLARPQFTLRTPAGTASVKLQLSGAHHASNAAAVVAAAVAAGISLDVAVTALEQVSVLSPHRMQMRQRGDGVVVIDDAYNANPESMHAALRALSAVAARRGRAWAVLGAMRELGDDAPAMHEQLGVTAAELGIDQVLAVGPDAAAVATAATDVGTWRGHARAVDDVDAAVGVLRDEVRPGDVVLVKASNSEQLWRVADSLLDAADLEVAT
jgi:UDP-N-acetylmuramoyl-tripeptide--D-alanyl-D-alanine ligase